MEQSNEEMIEQALKGACRPVAPPPELKRGLRERLILEAGSASGGHHSMLNQAKLGLIAAAGAISGLIGYGIWLSLHIPV